MKRNILLVSASAGAGHTRAADAIAVAWKHRCPDDQVTHLDLLQESTGFFRWLYRDFYLALAGKWPLAFRVLFEISDKPLRPDRVRQWFERVNCQPFLKKLQTIQPDIVIATHFSAAHLIAHARAERLIADRRTNIVVTDFDVHGTWLAESHERYFVANDTSAAYLRGLGVAAEKVTVSGVPVDALFAQPLARPDACARRGLDPARPVVLASTGGFGVGPVAEMIEKLFDLTVPAQVVAIAGKSEALKRELDALAARRNTAAVTLIPVGFTRDMHEYMAAADILIGKPGGLTSSEAMARALPMCIINPIPGQEERNADRMLEAGAAIRCHSVHTLAWQVDAVLRDPARLLHMRQSAHRLGKPLAAETVVNTILQGA